MNEKFVEITKCIVCGNDNKKILYSDIVHTCGILKTLGDQNNYKSNVYRCLYCDHAFLSPVLKEEIITKYYSILNSEYFEATPYNSRYKEEMSIYKKISKIKHKGKVLEIGCGYGFQLALFQNAGYECVGVEPSPKAHFFATNENKLNVIQGFVDAETFEPNSFDIILIMDVIEHLYKPKDLIKICSNILKQDGIIVILTGNIDSLNVKIWKAKWFYFYSWEHISFFNFYSIQYLLNVSHLSIIKQLKQSHSKSGFYNWIRFFVLNPGMYVYNFWIKRKYKHISLCKDHLLIIATKSLINE